MDVYRQQASNATGPEEEKDKIETRRSFRLLSSGLTWRIDHLILTECSRFPWPISFTWGMPSLTTFGYRYRKTNPLPYYWLSCGEFGHGKSP